MELSDGIEIGVYFLVTYGLLRYLQGTGGGRMIYGAIGLVGVVYLGMRLISATFPRASSVATVLELAGPFVVLALIVAFQPELRRGLMRLADHPVFTSLLGKSQRTARDELLAALDQMAATRTGALIAVERNVPLADFSANGVEIDARVSASLLRTIFHKGSPLHDGLVILSHERVAYARCILPATDPHQTLATHLGTRHGAGRWLSNQTDALVLIVSEERGAISTAVRGEITENYTIEALERFLKRELSESLQSARASEPQLTTVAVPRPTPSTPPAEDVDARHAPPVSSPPSGHS